MALRGVDRMRGSKWQSALPTGSKWVQAQPADCPVYAFAPELLASE